MNDQNHTYTKRIKGQKYVLGLGCSYTNPNFIPRKDKQSDLDNYDFPKWTELLKRHLFNDSVGLEVWSQDGASNEGIFNQAMHYLATDAENIELMVIGWTQWQRFNIWNELYVMSEIDPIFKSSKGKERNVPIYVHLFERMKVRDWGAIDSMIKWQLQYIYTIQEMCERLGVKYLMFTPMDSHFDFPAYKRIMNDLDMEPISDEKIMNMVLENDLTYMIKKDHYLDFPKFGEVFGDKTTTLNTHNHRFDIDNHPNENGHVFFANKLAEKYEKTYKWALFKYGRK